jgi:hypothetical protein
VSYIQGTEYDKEYMQRKGGYNQCPLHLEEDKTGSRTLVNYKDRKVKLKREWFPESFVHKRISPCHRRKAINHQHT